MANIRPVVKPASFDISQAAYVRMHCRNLQKSDVVSIYATAHHSLQTPVLGICLSKYVKFLIVN